MSFRHEGYFSAPLPGVPAPSVSLETFHPEIPPLSSDTTQSISIKPVIPPRIQDRLNILLNTAEKIADAERNLKLGVVVQIEEKSKIGTYTIKRNLTQRDLEGWKMGLFGLYADYVRENPEAKQKADQGLDRIRKKYKEDDGKSQSSVDLTKFEKAWDSWD